MDRELETYVDMIIEQQEYRSGIFGGWVNAILQAIADYRGTPNVRGAYSIRRGK